MRAVVMTCAKEAGLDDRFEPLVRLFGTATKLVHAYSFERETHAIRRKSESALQS